MSFREQLNQSAGPAIVVTVALVASATAVYTISGEAHFAVATPVAAVLIGSVVSLLSVQANLRSIRSRLNVARNQVMVNDANDTEIAAVAALMALLPESEIIRLLIECVEQRDELSEARNKLRQDVVDHVRGTKCSLTERLKAAIDTALGDRGGCRGSV